MPGQLPPEVREFARQNGFVPERELAPGYCSRVFVQGDKLLKAPFQGEETTSGFHAAYALQQIGGPQILAGDPTTGALIMERLDPGTSLYETPHPLDMETWLPIRAAVQALDPGYPGLLPLSEVYSNPPEVALKLIETTPQPVFLHGDLHHENILLHGEKWRPIDPKGLYGDPAYECTAFLRNPIGPLPLRPDFVDFTIQRIDLLHQKTGLDPARIAGWFYVDRWCDAQELEPENPWFRAMPGVEAVAKHYKILT